MFRYLGRAATCLFVVCDKEEETRLLYFSLFLIIILFFFFSPDDDNCAECFRFRLQVSLPLPFLRRSLQREIYIERERAHVVDKSHTTAGLKFPEQDDMR